MQGNGFIPVKLFKDKAACTIIKDGRQRTTEHFEVKENATSEFSAKAFEQGYQRLFKSYIRDNCISCVACKPARIPVHDLRLSANQRDLIKRNADISVHIEFTPDIKQHFPLYIGHFNERYKKSSSSEVIRFITNPHKIQTIIRSHEVMEFRDKDNRLVGASLYDRSADSLSGNKYYYDTALSKQRSLGIYMLLVLAEYCKSQNLNYLYLGSVTPHDQTAFSYKTRFRPLEIMNPDGTWQKLQIP
jgi:arginine-tRNA-protein transferase